MDYSILLNICSVIILICLLASYFVRVNMKIYNNSLIIVFISNILLNTVISTSAHKIATIYPMLSYILKSVYFFASGAAFSLLIVLIISNVNLRVHIIRVLLIYAVPLSLIFLFLIININTGAFFYINDEGTYIIGNYYFLMRSVNFYYFIFAIFMLKKYIRNISKDKAIVLSAIAGILLSGYILDFFFPSLLSLQFTLSICAVLLSIGMQEQSEYYSHDSLMMSRTAFFSIYSSRINSGILTRLIAVSIHNAELIFNTSQLSRILYVENVFLKKLRQFTKKTLIFNLAPGRYIIAMDEANINVANTILGRVLLIMKSLSEPGKLGLPVFSTCCPFSCPEDISNIKMVDSIFEKLKKLELQTPAPLITAADLNLKKASDIIKIEDTVKTALSENRLELYYQPIYSTKKGKYTSAEALIRMKDKDGNFIPPDIFIPIAEKSSLILEIGDFVLEQACRTISEEHLADCGLEYIEINLSMVECLQSNLASKVMGTLKRFGIDSSQINLEITETASDEFNDIVDQNINILNKYGVTFSIDDFGTGYSSFTRILSLKLNIIKLDKSIVQPPFIRSDLNSRLLLENFINIAASTGAKLVAEGVETKEMARGIIDLGCDYIQGYYFQKPVPRAEFVEIMKKNSPPDV